MNKWLEKETNQEAVSARDLKITMTKSTGEEQKVKEIVRETLDAFSATSLEYESNREIVAETIARYIVNEGQVSKRLR